MILCFPSILPPSTIEHQLSPFTLPKQYVSMNSNQEKNKAHLGLWFNALPPTQGQMSVTQIDLMGLGLGSTDLGMEAKLRAVGPYLLPLRR